MELALDLTILVAVVAAGSALARRFGVPAPLLLVVVGVAASYIPATPEYRLDPDLVLVGILPPLLYAAAIRTSVLDLRRDRRAIALLSVGLVAFTCVTVGLLAYWIVPDVPLAAAFALGAVVAPPDAVAATAVARRVRMPRRLVSILEGESLVNDATALVALSVSTAALVGSITLGRVGFEFLVTAGGGALVGLAVAKALVVVRRRVEDLVLDTTLSLLAPFVAFIAAEEISIDGAHPSGVLAVVIVGVVLGHHAGELQSASSRLAERINWQTVQFVLENAVFLLIGLQLRAVLEDAGDSGLGWPRLIAICLVVLLATIVVRFVWTFPATYLPLWLFPPIARADPSPPWTYPLVVSWAGMRGVVTLAAVFALPVDTPQRPALVLAAFAVVAGTLLVQGATLPALVRRLRLPGPDEGEDALAVADALQAAARAGIARLEELSAGVPDEVVTRLRDRTLDRANWAWERLGASTDAETPSEAYRRIRLEMLAAERAELTELRRTGRLDEEVLRNVQRLLDVEESILDRFDDVTPSADEPLSPSHEAPCEHLARAWPPHEPPEDRVCPPCVAAGTRWVHLRMCLACGAVGCCDSSPERHAHAHFEKAQHPVMRSIEPGEAWRWCFEDERIG
ncbi:MAG: Na+/H+ antiporter [Ilumatobacteraceae bacterium]